ncbi:MAG: carboxylating nicotinate-nucleotide diphosphorylase [Candidatus Methanomethylicia archaeon]
MSSELLFKSFIDWIFKDAPHGDLTSNLLIPRDCMVKAIIIAKSSGVAACVEEISEVLEKFGLKIHINVKSGQKFSVGDEIMVIEGSARNILLIERTLLNLLSYLFGVATSTRIFIEKARMVSSKVRIASTRKFPPGLGYLAKMAVNYGGGDTHRFSLSDAIIIKDNHLAIIGDLCEAIKIAKSKVSFIHKIEVEVRSLNEAILAVESGADVIMLDNMSVEEVSKVIEELKVRGLRDKVLIEVSGGINIDNIIDYAKLDVDIISTSKITMNPVSIDLSLEIVNVLK